MAVVKGATVPVNPHVKDLGVGISWDEGHVQVDVDLQALAVDDAGTIVDAVYYNNLKALRGALTHSGDETTGVKAGLDEMVWISLQRLPANIRMVIFIVAAVGRCHLRDIPNGKIVIVEDEKDNQSAVYQMEKSEEEVDAVLMLVRTGSSFQFHVLEEPARDGKHFMDILEPTIGNLIRGVIPGAPKRQKVAFAMHKGAVVDLPDICKMKNITAGLGWDASRLGGSIDLDVSVVCYDKSGNNIGAVYFGNKKEFGIEHSGDNLTGEGHGDDEVIKINLEKIPPNVQQLFFTVNIYTTGTNFGRVSNAYCRVCDESGQEMAKYNLSQGQGSTGLVIARLFREPDSNRFGFQAIGSFCRGNTWKDSLPDLKPLVQVSAREYQMQYASQTSMQQQIAGTVVGAQAPHQSHGSGDPGCCLLQ